MFRPIRNTKLLVSRGVQLTCCVMAIVATSSVASAIQISIDSFNKPDPASWHMVGAGGLANPSPLTVNQNVGNVLGGTRNTLIEVIGPGAPNSAAVMIGHYHTPGYDVDALQLNSAGTSPTVISLRYGSPQNPLGGANGLDLTGAGSMFAFMLHFVKIVDALPTTGLDVAVTITGPNNKTSTATAGASNSLSGFDLVIPFSSLQGNASPTAVQTLTFKLNGWKKTPNVDYVLDCIDLIGCEPVPEPESVVLLGIAAVGFGAVVYCTRHNALRRRLISVKQRRSIVAQTPLSDQCKSTPRDMRRRFPTA